MRKSRQGYKTAYPTLRAVFFDCSQSSLILTAIYADPEPGIVL